MQLVIDIPDGISTEDAQDLTLLALTRALSSETNCSGRLVKQGAELTYEVKGK